MATVANAIASLELNETPYWWLYSGSTKVGQSINTADMADSIARFRQIVELQPHGSYKVTGAKNPNDNRGGTSINFTISKDATANATGPAMHSTANAVITNPYGIPDHILKQVQEETRFKMLVEGMADDFKLFMKEWPDYKKKIDKIDAYLKDEDQDGTPDIMQMAKQATDTVKTVGEIKSVFEGGLWGK